LLALWRRCCLVLLWWRGLRTLWRRCCLALLWWRGLRTLWRRCGLTLRLGRSLRLTLWLRSGLTLLLWWSGLVLWLRCWLTLRLRWCLLMPRLRSGLALLLGRSLLPLLLRLLNCLTLRLRSRLVLLKWRNRLIAHRCYRRGFHVAIGGKRLADGYAGGTAMIHVGKLGSIGARCTLILHLGLHGRGVRFVEGCQFLRSRPRLDAA
jgi:hypothetical protein